MPPTIQNGTNVPEKTRPVKPVEKKSDLICKVKYCNTLPDIPFDLKFISYPFESTRFIQFNPTSLERNYRYDVLTEHDLGVGIDLINKDIYAVDHGAMLDPADEKLLEEDILTPQDSKRSRHHATSVSWLRRTEYISTEQTRFQPQTMDKVEAKVGYSIKKNLGNETMYMDRDSQIKAIEKTFEDTLRQPIEKHYSKPNVYATEVLPLFPDFSLWKFPCAQVIFDSDPAPVGKQMPAQIEEMSQAMIRGVMDESGEQFVAYFLPTEETLAKRREDFVQQIPYQDDVEYEYKMAREYNWNVKSKASKGYEENYFFVIRQDGAYYNELETRVRLSKRRQKTGAGAAGERQPQTTSNTRLVVKHRPMEANEFRMQRYREKQLEPNADEDDEMEMEQDEEEEEEEDQQQQQQDQEQEPEDNNNEDNESNKSGGGGSRSSSRSRSRSRSKSRSRSRSKSSAGSSRSRSRSRSKSGSEADKEEEGEEREGSEKGSDNEGGGSDAEEGSPARSRSRSRSKSRSQSRSRSGGSKSPASNRSRSGSRSKSRSKSRSRSKSKSRSRSGSPATSRASGARSRSGSPDAEEEEQNGGGGGGGGSGNEESENEGGGSGSEGGNNKSDSE